MPPQDARPAVAASRTVRAEYALIIATVTLTFIGYLSIALPLAVLPGYVNTRLGYGSVMAGATISLQYLATVFSRARVGQMADTVGPKRTVLRGLASCGLGGALMLAAALLAGRPALSLGALLASRLALGIGESLVGTGAITWAIGQVGPRHTARIISWNGVATFGALAAGAPIGVLLDRWFGFASIGIGCIALGALGMALGAPRPATPTRPGQRLSARSVLWRVLPFGMVLALGATGFGAIATFITLFYASRGWSGAALALTCFGSAFMASRLLFSEAIARHGGFRVALASLAVEGVGLLTLWAAGGPLIALVAAAITGFGFAMVFPSLGVVAVGLVPPQNRGAALGLYSVFLDVSLGVTGPVAGLLAGEFGFASPFLFGALATVCGLGLTAVLWRRAGRAPRPA